MSAQQMDMDTANGLLQLINQNRRDLEMTLGTENLEDKIELLQAIKMQENTFNAI